MFDNFGNTTQISVGSMDASIAADKVDYIFKIYDLEKRVKDDWKNLCNQEKDIVEYNIYFLCDEANKDKAVRHHPRGCEIATKVGYEYDIDSDSVYGELTTMRVVWLGMKGRTRVCTLGVVQTRMM